MRLYWLCSDAYIYISQVSLAAIPPGVSLSTAEAVLFVGKAVRILLRPGTTPTSVAAPPAAPDLAEFTATVWRLQRQVAFSHLELERAVSEVHSKVRLLAGFRV